MITSFSHYNLRAPRPLLDKLRDFYCNIVGLRLGDRPPFASFGYWLNAGEFDVLHLTESSADEHRVTHTATTFDHAAFNCRNRAEVETRLTANGIKYETARVPLTGRVQLFFSDPAGNGVELNFESAGGDT
jgi:catechol-2,3-dioxygenase